MATPEEGSGFQVRFVVHEEFITAFDKLLKKKNDVSKQHRINFIILSFAFWLVHGLLGLVFVVYYNPIRSRLYYINYIETEEYPEEDQLTP